jgi:polysaccharide biosynthesis transport protein
MKDLTRWELYDYLTVPWKRRWYFLAVTILVLAGTAIYAWKTPDMYRSEARILVESAALLDDNLSPNATRDRTEERINAIRQLLESRTILEQVIDENRMRSADSSTFMEDQVKDVRNYLEVSKSTGNIFKMAYVAEDRHKAQRFMRSFSEILIQRNRDAQKKRADNRDEFIEQELTEAQKALSAIDFRIKQFKEKNLGALPEQATANMSLLSSLNSQLAAVDTTLDRFRDQQANLRYRIQEQSGMLEMAKSIAPKVNAPAPETVSRNTPSPTASLLATKRAQLAETASRFTAKHPDVIRLKKEVEDLEQQIRESEAAANTSAQQGPATQSTPAAAATDTMGKNRDASQVELSAEAEIARANHELEILATNITRKEKERSEILGNITSYRTRLNLAPAVEQELMGLMNERDAQQKQVDNLATRKFNAQIAAKAISSDKNDIYTPLDNASLPERPIFPTRLHIILIGIGVSLVAGYGAALGREVVEPSLSNEDEVTALFKIPVLASIPEISRIPKR